MCKKKLKISLKLRSFAPKIDFKFLSFSVLYIVYIYIDWFNSSNLKYLCTCHCPFLPFSSYPLKKLTEVGLYTFWRGRKLWKREGKNFSLLFFFKKLYANLLSWTLFSSTEHHNDQERSVHDKKWPKTAHYFQQTLTTTICLTWKILTLHCIQFWTTLKMQKFFSIKICVLHWITYAI